MTTQHPSDVGRRNQTKFKIVFDLSLAALALAACMLLYSYRVNIKVLNIGDQIGERLQMRGLIDGGRHE